MPADYIDEVFGERGYLARKFPGYAPRAGQIAYARQVDATLRGGGVLMAEGPSGTGKSVGYLVPAIHHAVRLGGLGEPSEYGEDRADHRVVIVTANIALQEQLVRKDLPGLAAALPWKFEYALFKGRGNYLCQRKFAAIDDVDGPELFPDAPTAEQEVRATVNSWARLLGEDATGDVADVPAVPPPRVWLDYSSNAEECTGDACPFRHQGMCYADRARTRAASANVVVANYHLLFAHLRLREESGREVVLPPFDAVVLDEAHKAADIARDFFGFRVTAGMIRYAGRGLVGREVDDPVNKGKKMRLGHPLAARLAAEGDVFFDALLAVRRQPSYRARLRERGVVGSGRLCALLEEVATEYDRDGVHEDDSAPKRKRVPVSAKHVRALAANVQEAMDLSDQGSVYYIDEDARGRATLCASPIDVAERLRRTLFKWTRAVVCTSATLAVGGRFDHVVGELGATPDDGLGGFLSTREFVAESPFNWRERAIIVIPEMPEPSDPRYRDAVADMVARVIDLARGRTLALFTSYRNLNAAYARIKDSGHRVLKQGDMPRTMLVEEFRRDVGSVLLGTESFWAGVDVPGESLSCVIIDRLPFPTPDDPVLDALSERDRDWFKRHSLPRAVVTFKQGVGRLIRTVDDRGVVVVLDPRLDKKPYGAVFLRSLPAPLRWSRNLESIRKFLDGGAS